MSNEKDLDSAQNKQHKVGDAASNPQTTGPSENVREKAAQANDKSKESRAGVRARPSIFY